MGYDTTQEPMVEVALLITTADIRRTAEAALAERFDWSMLPRLAGRMALLLPRPQFQEFIADYLRELLAQGSWDIVANVIDGMVEAAPAGVMPVSEDLIADLLACPARWLQESTRALIAHRQTPSQTQGSSGTQRPLASSTGAPRPFQHARAGAGIPGSPSVCGGCALE